MKIIVSIGAASLGDLPKTVDELINYTDLALYEAKARGKNTVVFFRDLGKKFSVAGIMGEGAGLFPRPAFFPFTRFSWRNLS